MKLAGQIMAAVAGLAVALVDVAFVAAMVANGVFVIQANQWGVLVWSVAIGLAAALLVGSVALPSRHRAWMRGLAAILLAVIGIVGFYLFALLLVGAILAAISAALGVEPPRSKATER